MLIRRPKQDAERRILGLEVKYRLRNTDFMRDPDMQAKRIGMSLADKEDWMVWASEKAQRDSYTIEVAE